MISFVEISLLKSDELEVGEGVAQAELYAGLAGTQISGAQRCCGNSRWYRKNTTDLYGFQYGITAVPTCIIIDSTNYAENIRGMNDGSLLRSRLSELLH